MKGFLNFMSGAALGSIVGAALAILLAPTSGDDLRSQMQERVQYIQAEMKSAAATRRTELEQQLATMRAPRTEA
jgi:gas vesicle protein